jgi:hypothetical protein
MTSSITTPALAEHAEKAKFSQAYQLFAAHRHAPYLSEKTVVQGSIAGHARVMHDSVQHRRTCVPSNHPTTPIT